MLNFKITHFTHLHKITNWLSISEARRKQTETFKSYRPAGTMKTKRKSGKIFWTMLKEWNPMMPKIFCRARITMEVKETFLRMKIQVKVKDSTSKIIFRLKSMWLSRKSMRNSLIPLDRVDRLVSENPKIIRVPFQIKLIKGSLSSMV